MASGTACLWCQSRQWDRAYAQVRDRLRFVAGTWSYHRCVSCHALQLDPLPTKEELPTFYPATYHPTLAREARNGMLRWLGGWERELFFARIERWQVASVLRETHVPDGAQVLDVGCGTGERMLEFQRRGYNAIGVDFDANSVDHVQSRLGLPAHCADLADLGQLPFPETIQLVTAFYVLEHVVDVRAAVAEIHRLLSPGGWFVAAVPLADSWQADCFQQRWSQIGEAPRHVTIPSGQAVRGIWEEAGFVDIQLVPDTPWHAAAVAGLSLAPAAASGTQTRLLSRLAGVCVAAVWLPVAWWENRVIQRPALGIVLGRKPN